MKKNSKIYFAIFCLFIFIAPVVLSAVSDSRTPIADFALFGIS